MIIDLPYKLALLGQLKENWDGYGAKEISEKNIFEAHRVSELLISFGMPEPKYIPCSSGAIQLEWHTKKIELEILIDE